MRDTSERRRWPWSVSSGDPSEAHKLFRQQQALAIELRLSEAGRAALEDLAQHDDDDAVRLLAAAASLKWASPFGVQALEALSSTGGLLAFDAEMTLREYRAGRLSLDWT
jgi:hypothetical protein